MILKLHTAARVVWEKLFKKMDENGADNLLMADIFEYENFK